MSVDGKRNTPRGVKLMSSLVRAASALALAGTLLAGCASEGGSFFTTGTLGSNEPAITKNEPRVDPACVALVSRIETLRKEGVADKIERAATKKYKMTVADLAKADQLTKANNEFQMRCSTIAPAPTMASPAAPPKGPSRPIPN